MRTTRSSRALYDALSAPIFAPYVCKSCRQNALRPSITKLQQLRYASSNDIPFTEKIRRRIWGTDNPPGLKDPYGGPSYFEKRRMVKTAQTEDELHTAEDELQEEESQASEGREETRITSIQDDELPEGYKPAETWDGLEHIGHFGDWRDMRPERFDDFRPFTKMETGSAVNRAELLSCLHQAIVEHYTSFGKNYSGSSLPDSMYYEAVFGTRIILNEFNKISSLQYASDSHRTLLLEELLGTSKIEAALDEHNSVFEGLSAKREAGKLQTRQDLVDAWEELEIAETEAGIAAQRAPEAVSREEVPVHTFYKVPSEDFLAMSLDSKGNEKFLILKRFSQLSGHRIPDPLLSVGATVGQIIDHLGEAIKPKPKTLAETLMQDPEVAGISNLKIMTRRETPVDKEKEVGRWKLIEAELRSRGLPVLGRPQA